MTSSGHKNETSMNDLKGISSRLLNVSSILTRNRINLDFSIISEKQSELAAENR